MISGTADQLTVQVGELLRELGITVIVRWHPPVTPFLSNCNKEECSVAIKPFSQLPTTHHADLELKKSTFSVSTCALGVHTTVGLTCVSAMNGTGNFWGSVSGAGTKSSFELQRATHKFLSAPCIDDEGSDESPKGPNVR